MTNGSSMLRFNYPGESAAPGIPVDPAGRLALVDGDEAVRQSLLMLLSTRPGERVMRPSYGCPLHRLIFQPLDATTAGLAIHYVERAVRRWEPRAAIISIDAEPDTTGDPRLLVTLHYRVFSTQHLNTLELDLYLDGGP